jgi:hypothetical protein
MGKEGFFPTHDVVHAPEARSPDCCEQCAGSNESVSITRTRTLAHREGSVISSKNAKVFQGNAD